MFLAGGTLSFAFIPIKMCLRNSCYFYGGRNELHTGTDLPISYVGLSLGPQDPRGPPENCGTRRINCRYINSINIRQNFLF